MGINKCKEKLMVSCKHEWKISKDPMFNTQIRKCKKCGYEQRLSANVLSGKKRWKAS
jgi:hypothetical protein